MLDLRIFRKLTVTVMNRKTKPHYHLCNLFAG